MANPGKAIDGALDKISEQRTRIQYASDFARLGAAAYPTAARFFKEISSILAGEATMVTPELHAAAIEPDPVPPAIESVIV